MTKTKKAKEIKGWVVEWGGPDMVPSLRRCGPSAAGLIMGYPTASRAGLPFGHLFFRTRSDALAVKAAFEERFQASDYNVYRIRRATLIVEE